MKQKITFREKYDDLFSKKRNLNKKKEEPKIIPGCLVPSLGSKILSVLNSY